MNAKIIANNRIRGEYYQLVFEAPEMAARAAAGHFTHLRIDRRQDRILRRPFSIHDADRDAGTVTVVYKVVGHGTRVLRDPWKPDEISLCTAAAAPGCTFAWKIPWMEEPGRLQSMGSLRVGHD